MNILNHNNLNNKPVGFFDSGVGGLSVYSKFKKVLPFEDTLYFGDLAHLPYGNKSKDQLIGYAKKILDFYSQKDVKAVIIACNTSSAQAYDVIKNDYDFKIFPIIQSCAEVIASLPLERIGVFATNATVASKVYTKELQKFNSKLVINEIACSNWVDLVEGRRSNFDEEVGSITKEMLKFQPDKIILGCTHYPYLLGFLEKFAPKDLFIDPAEIFVNYIKKNLLLNDKKELGIEKFFVSAEPENFVKHAKIFYEIKSNPEVVNTEADLCIR